MTRKTILDIADLKAKKTPIVALTAYTYNVAQILDEHCDIILVGDSLGMVLYGYETTIPVDIKLIMNHAEAVVRASKNAMVVADIPFGYSQKNKEHAFDNCAKLLKKTGAQAVKLEGGEEMAETIKYLTDRGIPVMGHIGFKPQSVNMHGGYKRQGKTKEDAKKLVADAKAVEESGAFAVVVECVSEKAAKDIHKKVSIPVIGIGAGKNCDGQILVTEDMLGITEFAPGFVKNYGGLRDIIQQSVETYSKEVRNKKFPSK